MTRPPAGTIPDAPGSYQFKDALGRVILVQVAGFGRRTRRAIGDVAAGRSPDGTTRTWFGAGSTGMAPGTGLRGRVLIPTDAALAAGSRIPYNRLARPTRRAVRQLAELIRPPDAG